MNSKKLLLTAFILMALAQWYVPAKMILDREVVLSTGKDFRFRIAPIDPNDPFRGKYITLNFRENRFPVSEVENWERNDDVYVVLGTDRQGFAKIQDVSKVSPRHNAAIVKARVQYVESEGDNHLIIEYPFNRFYMEESKAFEAERVYMESLADTTKVTYALVSIRENRAVLKDVLVDGTSLKELVKARQRE